MKKFIAGFFLVIGSVSFAAQLPTGFTEQLVAQGLDPTDMVLTPDGRIFITIKSGKVLIVEDGVLRGTPLISIETLVDNYNERGLGHIVLDPSFENNGYFYLYYTAKGNNYNRVSRFKAIGNFTSPSDETQIINLDVMAGTIHNGGDMIFGADGKLFIAVGDGGDGNTSQSLNTVLGKMLRINSDGTIPADNPFAAQTSGKNKAIWALGFRNPFSIDVQPGTGKIFACDVGGGAWEEVNEVQAGKNYGWPGIEGKRVAQPAPPNYKDPLYAYAHGGGADQGCSIVGASFYNPATSQFPSFYNGRFFFADYCNGYIKSIDTSTGTVQTFATNINRPLAMIIAPDGSMFYLARAGIGGGSDEDNTSTNDGTLWKITYTGSGAPSISVPPQSTLVVVGESATFNVFATGTAPLAYQWQMDGVDINGATQSAYTFADAQITDHGKQFRCKVANSFGDVISAAASLSVTNTSRPVPVLTATLPGGAAQYKAGQTISFSGSATDAENGTLPASALTWKINFHHDAHVHPALGATTGIASGVYIIPQVGETSDNVWYRVSLTAIDLDGLSKTVYQDIFPQKTAITLTTVPAGLQLLLDGQPLETPHTFNSVVNATRTLEAPISQVKDNNLYTFDHWSENSAPRLFTFDTPETAKTFTAFFNTVPVGSGTGLTGFYYGNQDKTFTGQPDLVRLDATVNFNWGDGAPASGITPDHFTVRWLGEVLPQFTEEYTFSVTADDGIRLWVNNVLLIDKWIDQPPTQWSGTMLLMAGQKYPVKIEYYENGGGAVAQLHWSCSKFAKQIIPASQLSNDVVTAIESTHDRQIRIYPTLIESNFIIENNSAAYGAWTIIDCLG
ncbi:MAG: PQQ-dependent sugar dehydrogenase, partial [Bacteroidota bacterium]